MKSRETIKRIHVDMHAIRRNLYRGADEAQEPVVTVQNRGRSTKAFEVRCEGGVIRQALKPLSCGARVWIETRGAVIVDGKKIE